MPGTWDAVDMWMNPEDRSRLDGGSIGAEADVEDVADVSGAGDEGAIL